jgi:hypothetical protein
MQFRIQLLDDDGQVIWEDHSGFNERHEWFCKPNVKVPGEPYSLTKIEFKSVVSWDQFPEDVIKTLQLPPQDGNIAH